MKLRPLRLVAGVAVLASGATTGAGTLLALSGVAGASLVASPLPPPPPPALALTDTAGTALYGAAVPFHLSVTDNAVRPALDVQLSETLPPGVSYVAGSTLPASVGEPRVVPGTDGSTRLVWSAPGVLMSGASEGVSFQVLPAVAPAAGAVLPGGLWADSAVATAVTDGAQRAVASTTVPVTALAETETASPLPAGMARGLVWDTIRLQASPAAGVSGAGVDLYLPPSVSFVACPPPVPQPAPAPAPGAPGPAPASCVLPATATPVRLQSAADATPLQPVVPGPDAFSDLHWVPVNLAAGGTQTFSLLLSVTNPTSFSAPAPAVLASTIAVPAVAAAGTQTPVATQTVAVGTPPPPPPPPPPPAPAAPTHASTPPPHTPVFHAATPNVAAASVPTVTVPAVANAAAGGVAGAATGGAVGNTATAGTSGTTATTRDPFLPPGQTESPQPPTTVPAALPSPVLGAVGALTTTVGSLPHTGADVYFTGGVALSLILAGGGLLWASRPSRRGWPEPARADDGI